MSGLTELPQSEERDGGVLFGVKAHPGARRSRISGVHGGLLKVEVTTPPEKGKANKAIIELLAGALGCPKRSVVLVSGDTAGQKRFRVDGMGKQAFEAALRRYGEGNDE